MIKKPDHAFSLSRRDTLKKTGIALCAGMLPLASPAAQTVATPADEAHRKGARYRRPNASSKMGARMLKSYARAVRAMLALPPEDPRNWYRHAIIHTMDCPHGNWWFLPWHRGYLGWFEQICRELSRDPQFAMPYWDWTAEPKIPAGMFDDVLDPNHSAYIPTAHEFESRLKSAIADAGYWTSPNGIFTSRSQYGQLLMRGVRFDADLLFDILTDPSGRLFYEQPGARGIRRERPEFAASTADAVSLGTIHAALAAPDFPTFASLKSSNHATMAGFGILEAKPHNSVHRCVGTRDCNFVEPRGFMTDMLSPVDPIFFLHHANMDRLWDVWTRKQILLGLPILPSGAELRTNLPDEQKSAEEKNTDYYRWAREPLLFFVDSEGVPVTKTRAEDYASMAAFGYDYEPGSGEDVVAKAVQSRPKRSARRVFNGKVVTRQVDGARMASAVVQLPSGAVEQAVASGTVLVANITLNFSEHAHQPYVLVLNAPDDLMHADADSPYYLATISMIGRHHGTSGALSYAIPLGEKLRQGPADGAIRLRIVPLHSMDGHHVMGNAHAVELLAVNVESY